MKKLLARIDDINAEKALIKAQSDEKKRARKYDAIQEIIRAIFPDDADEILFSQHRHDGKNADDVYLISGGWVFRSNSSFCGDKPTIGVMSYDYFKRDPDYNWSWIGDIDDFAQAVLKFKALEEEYAKIQKNREGKEKAPTIPARYQSAYRRLEHLTGTLKRGQTLNSSENAIVALVEWLESLANGYDDSHEEDEDEE